MPATLRLGSTEPYPFRESTLTAFREQTGIQVDLVPLRRRESRLARIEQLEPPADLLLLDEFEVVDRIREGSLAMLGRRAHAAGIDLDDFPQAAIDRFRASDAVYAIPLTLCSNVLWYRPDVLDRLDLPVPSTWDELRSVAGQVRVAGGDELIGFAGPGLAGARDNYELLAATLFPSWGCKWNRGPALPPAIHDPATVDSTAFYAALIKETSSPEHWNLSRSGAREVFAAGRAAFSIDSVTAFAQMQKESLFPVALTPVPLGPTGRPEPGLSVRALCIPSSSSSVDNAWELLERLISFEEMLAVATEGGQPESARVSVFEAEPFAASYEVKMRSVMWQTRRFARMNHPLIAGASDLGDIVGAAVEAVIMGEQTADEALSLAQAMIDSMTWSR